MATWVRTITIVFKGGALDGFERSWTGSREPSARLPVDGGVYVLSHRSYQGKYIYHWEAER